MYHNLYCDKLQKKKKIVSENTVLDIKFNKCNSYLGSQLSS